MHRNKHILSYLVIQGLVRKTGHGRDRGDDVVVCEACNCSKGLFYIVLLAALFPFFLSRYYHNASIEIEAKATMIGEKNMLF